MYSEIFPRQTHHKANTLNNADRVFTLVLWSPSIVSPVEYFQFSFDTTNLILIMIICKKNDETKNRNKTVRVVRPFLRTIKVEYYLCVLKPKSNPYPVFNKDSVL